MKTFILTLTFSLLFLTSSAKKISVTIKLINKSSHIVTAYIDISDNVGSTNSNNLVIQDLQPNGSHETTLKNIEKYSVLTGYAIFKNGGKSREKYKIVSNKTDQFTYEVKVPDDVSSGNLMDLTNSSKILEYDPSKFLDNDGTPKSIEGLFSQYLGGLVAFTNDTGTKIRPMTTISPTDLKTKMRINYGTGTASKEINFANQNEQEIKGSIPAAAALNINWNNASMYSLKLEYSKIGVIDYQSNGTNLSEAFNNLSSSVLYNLGYLKLTYPTLKLRQINQAYVFEAVYIEAVQGNSMDASNEVSASTFFSNKGNFNISNKSLDKKAFGNSYLGYWANPLSADLTGSLNYAVAVYSSVTSSVLSLKTEAEVLEDYEKLRKSNPSLPELQKKQDIQNYFKNIIEQFKKMNPQFKEDSLLLGQKLEKGDRSNKMTDLEVKKEYDILKDNINGLPDTFDSEAARLYLQMLKEKSGNKVD